MRNMPNTPRIRHPKTRLDVHPLFDNFECLFDVNEWFFQTTPNPTQHVKADCGREQPGGRLAIVGFDADDAAAGGGCEQSCDVRVQASAGGRARRVFFLNRKRSLRRWQK